MINTIAMNLEIVCCFNNNDFSSVLSFILICCLVEALCSLVKLRCCSQAYKK